MKRIFALFLAGTHIIAGCSPIAVNPAQDGSASNIETIMPHDASNIEVSFVKAVETAFAHTNTVQFAKMFYWNGITTDESLRKIYHQGDLSIMQQWSHKLELKRVDPKLETEEFGINGTRNRANLPVRWKLIAHLSNGGTSEYRVGETNGTLMVTVSSEIK